MAYEQFPSSLPCPMFDGYSATLNSGLKRTIFENGRSRMRRSYTVEYRTAQLVFTFSTAQLATFQQFANKRGYDWFFIDVPTGYSGYTNPFTRYPQHLVRFISDIEYSALNADTFRLSIAIEFMNGYIPAGAVVPTERWIVAGRPATPSSNWIIARTPASPSTDTIVSGSPGAPSATRISP
jgi:hypothetical protein